MAPVSSLCVMINGCHLFLGVLCIKVSGSGGISTIDSNPGAIGGETSAKSVSGLSVAASSGDSLFMLGYPLAAIQLPDYWQEHLPLGP